MDLSTTIICCRLRFWHRSKLLKPSRHFTVSLPSSLLIAFKIFLRTFHLPHSSPFSKHFRSSKGNVFISPTDIYCILIGLHHPLTVLKHTLWVALFPVFRFSITFSLCEPPLFMLFSSFQSNHSVDKPSSLPFLPSLQLFQWLIKETSQTHLCLPETFHQRLAESILHKTLPPLAIHRGIPLSLQPETRTFSTQPTTTNSTTN